MAILAGGSADPVQRSRQGGCRNEEQTTPPRRRVAVMQEGEPHVFLFLRLIFGPPSNVWHRGMFKNLMACVLRRGVGADRPTFSTHPFVYLPS